MMQGQCVDRSYRWLGALWLAVAAACGAAYVALGPVKAHGADQRYAVPGPYGPQQIVVPKFGFEWESPDPAYLQQASGQAPAGTEERLRRIEEQLKRQADALERFVALLEGEGKPGEPQADEQKAAAFKSGVTGCAKCHTEGYKPAAGFVMYKSFKQDDGTKALDLRDDFSGEDLEKMAAKVEAKKMPPAAAVKAGKARALTPVESDAVVTQFRGLTSQPGP